MSRRVIFCVMVGNIGYSWVPVHEELSAAGIVADPVETHGNGFGALLFDGVICKLDSGLVVNLHRCGWLGVAKFADHCGDGDGFLCIDIGGADFGFGGKSHDVGHDFGHGVNGSIEPWESSGRHCQIGRTVAEKIMANGTATGTGCGKVRGVAVDIYNHVAGGVSNGGVRVGIGVVEEPQGFIVGFFGGLRLLGREGVKGDKHGGINGDGVIEECAYYLLHEVNGLRGQQGGVVRHSVGK